MRVQLLERRLLALVELGGDENARGRHQLQAIARDHDARKHAIQMQARAA